MPARSDVPPQSERSLRARRSRNIAVGIALGALCVLFYVVTFVKGAGVLTKPL